MLCFPGFGCATENFTKISRQKRCEKRKNFHANFTLLGRSADKTAVFSAVEIFRRVFSLRFFAALFRRTFFAALFRHIFRQARPSKLLRHGISIHVTTKRLCQMRWHNINNSEKHAIMEEGAGMPETHCLSHPLCLTTLMEHTCDTHYAPSHQI